MTTPASQEQARVVEASSRSGWELALRLYAESHHGDLSDIAEIAQVMYGAGFRDSINHMVKFQDLPEQMRRIEQYVSRVCHIFEAAGVLEP